MSVDNHSVKQEATFYHPKPERFAEICQRFFRYIDYNYSLAQREVPIPALLRYTGLPVARNQFCFSHKGQGTALSVYRHRKGFWMFHCCGCGIQGDVVKMWYLMVKLSGFAPIAWDMPQACGDLLARAEAGIIDLSVEELETSSHSRGARRARGTRAEDPYWNKLKELDKHRPILGSSALPSPISISNKEAILGLHPENRPIMLAQHKRKFHPIMMRDKWLAGCYDRKPVVSRCSFVSSNYCCRDDVDGTSYDAFEGVDRRWLVIEGDRVD